MHELQIRARPSYLSATPCFIGGVPEGQTLAQIVQEVYRRGGVPTALRQHAVVQINGEFIARVWWGRVRPKALANIVVTLGVHGGGGGGKNPLGLVMSLAVIVAAPYLGAALGAVTGVALGMPELMVGLGTAFTGLVGAVGLYAVNALFPTRANITTSKTYQDSPTYSITGAQNAANLYSPVPVVLGRHRLTPPLGAKTYTEIIGNEEYLRMMFVWGYGPLQIEDIRIGDTPITDYDDIEIETRGGRADDVAITLMPSQVMQDGIGVSLLQSGGWTQRTTATNADEISVDISFPGGLVRFTDSGDRAPVTVEVEVQYRAVGADDWVSEYNFVVTDQFVGNLRKGYRWKVARGQYQVRMRRVTADSGSDRVTDDVTWTNLRTIRADAPVKFPYPLAMTAIRIRASDQLQGVIDNLNGLVTSYAPVWDGATWGGEEPTQNNAALMRLALTGPGSVRPRTARQIDDARMGQFYEFCAENGYVFNMVRDFAASVWDVCADICSAARAAPAIIDGKWGVIMDTPGKPVVQHFTPRNSWGFAGEINYVDFPHAWRASFTNEDNNFQKDERIVYDDGYDETTATKFEGIEFPGITSPDLVWKFGRYHIAQARLRPQSYTFNADIENLVCQRGDRIRVSHDVPKFGGGASRVKSLTVDGDNTTRITLDEVVVMETGKSYVCRFRLADGSSLLCAVALVVGETRELSLQTSLPTASGPQAGDLAMFGETDRETVDLLVKKITPGKDLTAAIECVDYAPDIYLADQGAIPPFDSKISQTVDVTQIKPPSPQIIGIESGSRALERSVSGIKSRILVTVQAGNTTLKIAQYTVRYRNSNSSEWRYVQQPFGQSAAILPDVKDDESYVIQAAMMSIYGVQSDWTDVITEMVKGQKEPPRNITGFTVNVIDGTAYGSWDAATDIDHDHCRLRWSPELSIAVAWNSATDVTENIAGNSFAVPARAGTYLLKAVDVAGNESLVAAAAMTNVTAVRELNFIEKISAENPDWQGWGQGVVYAPSLGGLVLDAAGDLYDAADLYAVADLYQYGGLRADGLFVLDQIVDLQGKFKVRLTSELAITATNLGLDLYTQADLYASGDLYDVQDGQASARAYIRVTDNDPAGTPGWSNFMPFVVGEYEGRAFQMAVGLISTASTVTPIVSYAATIIDMQDRSISFDQIIPSGGGHIAYAPAFFVTPKLVISGFNGEEGDKWTVSNETASGFDIAFINAGSPVSRRVTGTANAYGAAL